MNDFQIKVIDFLAICIIARGLQIGMQRNLTSFIMKHPDGNKCMEGVRLMEKMKTWNSLSNISLLQSVLYSI